MKQRTLMGSLRNHHRKTRRRQETSWYTAFDFSGPTIDVAKRLIGAIIIRDIRDRNGKKRRCVARIVETEAYLPFVDPACHGYRGPTKRNASIFGRAGTAYVYFIYGNHYCLNVVTEQPGIGGAVLVRAAEPIEGLEVMRERRPGVPDAALLSGPGNLCRALGIDRAEDAESLSRGDLRIVASRGAGVAVDAGPRIGLSAATTWPLRFTNPASASISPFRRSRSEKKVSGSR